MTKTNTNERLDAALAWGRLPRDERSRRMREADLTPIEHAEDPFAEFVSGPTDVVRMNRNVIALAMDAWPDANVRRVHISKLIVIAARKALIKRLDTNPAQ